MSLRHARMEHFKYINWSISHQTTYNFPVTFAVIDDDFNSSLNGPDNMYSHRRMKNKILYFPRDKATKNKEIDKLISQAVQKKSH